MASTIWSKMFWEILSARYLAMRCTAFVNCGERMSCKIYIHICICVYLSCVEWFLMALTMPDICCRNLEFNISSFMILFGALNCRHRHTMDVVGDGSCSIRALFTVLSSGRRHWHRGWRASLKANSIHLRVYLLQPFARPFDSNAHYFDYFDGARYTFMLIFSCCRLESISLERFFLMFLFARCFLFLCFESMNEKQNSKRRLHELFFVLYSHLISSYK